MNDANRQDVFISHASADKTKYVFPLTAALTARSVTFWLDSNEIGWGDSVAGKINSGLRNTRFALVCLSKNFLERSWPESEMAAVLSLQNTDGVRRVLPLVLNSKHEVLKKYPLIGGLAYREFSVGVDILADEVSKTVGNEKDTRIRVTVEGVHTGKLCQLKPPRRASVQWLSRMAQSGLDVREALDVGQSGGEFRVRWVLVDVNAESEWRALPRSKQRKLHALVAAVDGIRPAHSARDRLNELGVRNGTVFHLYAIEDEEFDPPVAACCAM